MFRIFSVISRRRRLRRSSWWLSMASSSASTTMLWVTRFTAMAVSQEKTAWLAALLKGWPRRLGLRRFLLLQPICRADQLIGLVHERLAPLGPCRRAGDLDQAQRLCVDLFRHH
jgi:hypothetical protein